MGLKIKAAVYSHIGGRSNNEDNFYFNGVFMNREQMNLGGEMSVENLQPSQIYAVCDGMGGAEFGEEASLRAVQALKVYQEECQQPDSSVYLGEMVARVSQAVDDVSLSNNMPSGASGSTLAMLIFNDWYFRTAHVGDSRVYRLRAGCLERITKDHSEVQRLVDIGQITMEQAWQHPQKNVITKHLGMPTNGRPLLPTLSERMDLRQGDRFLICSDGLSDVVHDTVIAEMMKNVPEVKQLTEALVSTALQEADAFGIQSDNITVIVLDVAEVGRRENAAKKIKKLRTMKSITATVMVLLGCGFVYTAYDLIRFILKK